MYLYKTETAPKNKNNVLLIAVTWYTKYVTFCVPLQFSVTVSIFTVSAFIFLTLTPKIAFPLLPVHYIPPSVPSTALDMQHSLNPFTLTSGQLHCHADMIHVDEIVHLFLYYIEEVQKFSPQIVLVVFRILYTCVLDVNVVSVICISVRSWLFYGFWCVD